MEGIECDRCGVLTTEPVWTGSFCTWCLLDVPLCEACVALHRKEEKEMP